MKETKICVIGLEWFFKWYDRKLSAKADAFVSKITQ